MARELAVLGNRFDRPLAVAESADGRREAVHLVRLQHIGELSVEREDVLGRRVLAELVLVELYLRHELEERIQTDRQLGVSGRIALGVLERHTLPALEQAIDELDDHPLFDGGEEVLLEQPELHEHLLDRPVLLLRLLDRQEEVLFAGHSLVGEDLGDLRLRQTAPAHEMDLGRPDHEGVGTATVPHLEDSGPPLGHSSPNSSLALIFSSLMCAPVDSPPDHRPSTAIG